MQYVYCPLVSDESEIEIYVWLCNEPCIVHHFVMLE